MDDNSADNITTGGSGAPNPREALARAHLMADHLSIADIPSLKVRLDGHAKELAGSRDEAHLAPTIAGLHELLDAALGLDEEDRALVRGAVEYFILGDDFEADDGPDGLADDLAVVEAVKTHISRH